MALIKTTKKVVQDTSPGIWVSAGEISNDFDKVPWKDLIKDYSDMRDGGAVESTTISVLKYPLLRAGYQFTHDNEEMVDYLYWIFDSLIDSFKGREGARELLEHILLALEFGCSFFEKIYQRGVVTPNGKVTNRIVRLAPFRPETIFDFYFDDNMFFSGIRHERRGNRGQVEFIDIDVDELFFYSHNAEYGDPRGRSEYRPARHLYKIKKDILLATARAQQRGAGIPEIKSRKSGLTPEEKARLEQIGRSVGNMKNGYIITDNDTELILHGLQVQGSPEATLEFINRELFFNTLTEFMTSGIGQNGSKAATGEHKSSYELKFAAITRSIESRINSLIREMIDMSYFGPQAEYPLFQFHTPDTLDITSVSSSIAAFYDREILVKQEGDEEFIRSLFNLPEKIVIGEKKEEKEFEDEKPEFKKELFFRSILPEDEYKQFTSEVFDKDNKEKLYDELKQQTNLIIEEVIEKYVAYATKQLSTNKQLELKYEAELYNRLNKLFQLGYKQGVEDVNVEIVNMGGVRRDSVERVPSSLKRHSSQLASTIKTTLEDIIEVDDDKEYAFSQLSNQFKTDKRRLVDKVSDSYILGRLDAMQLNEDQVELYLYNSILDKNLCDVCAEWTGAVLTLEEAKENGFTTGTGRVNSGCLGGKERCRCNLLVYRLRGES